MMRRSVFAFALCLAGTPALAQTLPPSPQELQQQHDQTVQSESNDVHNNLNQTGQQIQQHALQPYYVQQPFVTPHGHVVTPPPVAMPR